jgi:hypothetical protein
MPNLPRCEPSAGTERFILGWLASAALALLAGCTPPAQQAPVAVATPPAAPPPVVQPVPFPTAVTNAADAVFSGALAHGQQTGGRQIVVIDPLVNGVTGEQSAATQQIQERIVELAREKYPQFDIVPFSAAAVRGGPNVMVGTFTPVNAQGQTAGARQAPGHGRSAGWEDSSERCREGADGRGRFHSHRILPGQSGLDQRCERQELH